MMTNLTDLTLRPNKVLGRRAFLKMIRYWFNQVFVEKNRSESDINRGELSDASDDIKCRMNN